MLQIETLVPKGINKDVSPRALDRGGNRLVTNPLTDALNARYLTSESGDIDVVQNIPGTVGYDPGLPAGTNYTIGAYNDVTNNQIIFFNYNSNGNHGIYTWNPITQVFRLLIGTSLLGFSLSFRITGIGVVNRLLYWTNFNTNQCMINMDRDYTGIAYEEQFSLFKRGPQTMQADVSGDTSQPTNSLSKNVYQFSKRYVYLDNEISALSIITPHQNTGSNDTYTQFLSSSIAIVDTRENEIASSIKKVQFLYQKNNDSNWYIFYEAQISEYLEYFVVGVALLFLQFRDNRNNEIISTADSVKIFDAIPKKSKTLAAFRSRTFLTSDVEGYEFDRPEGRELILAQGQAATHGYKEGGRYTFGIAYYDKNLRTPGVTSVKDITMNYFAGSPTGTSGDTPQIFFQVNGKAPTWAKYWSLVRSKEQFYEEYMQIPVKVMFYVGEGGLKNQAGADVAIPGTMEKYNNGKIYLKDVTGGGITAKCKYLHLNCPEQMPFVPTTDHQVRIITAIPGGPTSKIIGGIIKFDGESIVTDNFGIDDWSWYGSLPAGITIWIEVFKPSTTVSKPLYETNYFFKVNADGGHNPLGGDGYSAGPIIGDTYKFRPDTIVGYVDPITGIVFSYTIPNQNKSVFKFRNMKIEGQATTTAYRIESLVFTGYTESPSPILVKSNEDAAIRVVSATYTQVHADTSLVPDYDKIANNLGRPLLAINNSVEIIRNTTIRFSDTYIQDSNINGLSSFAAANEYVLPTSSTPITKLQPAGDILLCVHQRQITSLYIGFGVITDGNGNETITKTTSVIGNDRTLDGGYGSYHAESIAEIEGVVFGFDIFRGAVWRYTNAGIKPPISDYGMAIYFKALALKYLPYKDSVAIIGGIDPYNKEYILTFPAIPGSEAVTWAFNYKANVWSHRYSFIPECYCTTGNDLVSFKDGKLWVHNKDYANCNTFYGVKYNRQLRFSVNPYPSKVKNWESAQLSADSLAQDNGGDAFVIRCYDVEGQETYTRARDFEKLEGIFYGFILKNINSLVPAGQMALREGDDMRSQVLDVLIEHDGKDRAKMSYANIVFVMSEYSK